MFSDIALKAVVLAAGDGTRLRPLTGDMPKGMVEVVDKPDEPTSNLVMTGFYTFSPAIFHACHLVQPSNRGEYEISEAIDLLIQSGRTIDAIRLEGWQIDVGYPDDRDEAERRLTDVVNSTLLSAAE